MKCLIVVAYYITELLIVNTEYLISVQSIRRERPTRIKQTSTLIGKLYNACLVIPHIHNKAGKNRTISHPPAFKGIPNTNGIII